MPEETRAIECASAHQAPPWPIVPAYIRVDDRNADLASLKRASIDQDMEPFARLLAERVESAMERAGAKS